MMSFEGVKSGNKQTRFCSLVLLSSAHGFRKGKITVVIAGLFPPGGSIVLQIKQHNFPHGVMKWLGRGTSCLLFCSENAGGE